MRLKDRDTQVARVLALVTVRVPVTATVRVPVPTWQLVDMHPALAVATDTVVAPAAVDLSPADADRLG
jgi:hypothetical protein